MRAKPVLFPLKYKGMVGAPSIREQGVASSKSRRSDQSNQILRRRPESAGSGFGPGKGRVPTAQLLARRLETVWRPHSVNVATDAAANLPRHPRRLGRRPAFATAAGRSAPRWRRPRRGSHRSRAP